MTGRKITWLEVDPDILTLSPLDALKYFTRLSSQRPIDEPWAAFIRPIMAEQEPYYSLGISLGAQYEFAPELIVGFAGIADTITREFTDQENGWIHSYQESQGNPVQAWNASAHSLEVIVPSRHVDAVKGETERLFEGTAAPLVEVPVDRQ